MITTTNPKARKENSTDFIKRLNEKFFTNETAAMEISTLFNRLLKSIKNRMHVTIYKDGQKLTGRVLYYTPCFIIAVIDGKKVKAKKFRVMYMGEIFFSTDDLKKLKKYINF